jgi:hypothetical protein
MDLNKDAKANQNQLRESIDLKPGDSWLEALSMRECFATL